jgi:hypothetical protein
MKASRIRPEVQRFGGTLLEPAVPEDGIDLELLEENLSKTIWKRMLANDDALRLADLLHSAMLKARAKC